MENVLNELLLPGIIIIIINLFMEHIWNSRHYSKLYKWITPFNLHRRSMKWILFFLFYFIKRWLCQLYKCQVLYCKMKISQFDEVWDSYFLSLFFFYLSRIYKLNIFILISLLTFINIEILQGTSHPLNIADDINCELNSLVFHFVPSKFKLTHEPLECKTKAISSLKLFCWPQVI